MAVLAKTEMVRFMEMARESSAARLKANANDVISFVFNSDEASQDLVRTMERYGLSSQITGNSSQRMARRRPAI